ncbi:MAG TPA: NAD-dependent epimerase/dehydratase family protein [Candidatus Limnocylindrales bacterium]|nr:NAD-dependent epimerase/dehydratase family protein [Candidatus Limnocylindrales bacterium]
MRALVTGGAGFIGHHLVNGLVDAGWDVAVVDDLATGRVDRLAGVGQRVEVAIGDIRDPAVLDPMMRGRDVVFHEAAIPSVGRSVVDPRRTSGANIDGTIEVMLAASRAGVRRVIAAGSSSVYGESPELPRRETQRPDPRSPYAASKLAAEHFVHALGRLHGIETVVLRYFNVYGPNQDPDSAYAAVVPRFITAALRGASPVVTGDGHQTRDFTYVDDVVAANLLAAAAADVSGLTCNIGGGGRFSLLELLDLVSDAVGRPIQPTFAAPRPADVPHSQADISLARDRLGFSPSVDFAEGIRRTVAWYREREAGSRPDDADPAGAGLAVG